MTLEIESAAAATATAVTREQAAELLHGHRHLLEGLAITLTRDVALAQDIVQDTIEAVFTARVVFAGESNVLAYARRTVVNRCHSTRRRAKVAARHAHRFLSPPAPSADELVLLADEHRMLLDAFYRLPPRQRECLALRHFGELDDNEIAIVLQISPVSVRSNVSRGLNSLRALVKEFS